MAKETYRTKPFPSRDMPPGIPFIIGNEAAERFSFYGMRGILMIFMVKYLWLMGDTPGVEMSDTEATKRYHDFVAYVYLTPFIGALIADVFFGKYRVIIWLSLIYCIGHAALAMMGYLGKPEAWLSVGLWLIIFGSGGIKPCVSAHVGDQFGEANQNLLAKIFNWFYFSINLGAFVSGLLTPWLLEWYGPHWAFGVPGILMLIATICFWAGRHKFVHIPVKGHARQIILSDRPIVTLLINGLCFLAVLVAITLFAYFASNLIFAAAGNLLGLKATAYTFPGPISIGLLAVGAAIFAVRFKHFSQVFAGLCKLVKKEWILALGKLCIIYLFVVFFWALFDQTGSSWVLQAEDMDRNFLGVEWLSSQIQALNPILILIYIPLFTYIVYPAINRVFKLTPLRKISIGLFIMTISFAVIAIAQGVIDSGGKPSISWQLVGYLIITAAEVMVSIVCLEFSYTQAPRSMKSFVMALFLMTVFFGNKFTSVVNGLIAVKTPTNIEWQDEKTDTKTLAGFDKQTGTDDDIILHRDADMEFKGKGNMSPLVEELTAALKANQFASLNREAGNTIAAKHTDPWGNPYRYTMVNSRQCRVTSLGPDKKYLTQWDQGVVFNLNVPRPAKEPGAVAKMFAKIRPQTSWIETRKRN